MSAATAENAAAAATAAAAAAAAAVVAVAAGYGHDDAPSEVTESVATAGTSTPELALPPPVRVISLLL